MLKRSGSRHFALFLFLFSGAGWGQVGPVRLAISPANPVLLKTGTQQLGVGQRFFRSDVLRGAALPGAAVVWSSSDTNIAAVDANGFVQTTNPGIATISARIGPFQGSTKIIVTATALTSITVSPAAPTIHKGTSAQLTATGTFADLSTVDLTNSVTWSSADSSMANVNSHGMCRGIKQGGPVTITAKYGSVSGSTDVTIGPPVVVSIALTPANAQAPLGSVEQFTAMAIMSDDTQQDVTKTASWSATGAASINATGLATGNALGAATISATLQNVSGSTSWLIFLGTRSRYIRATFPAPLSFQLYSAVYDPARKLIFANNFEENRLDVIAGPDYHLAASIPVPFPLGLDLTADGTKLLVCSQKSVLAIDPDTLRIVGKTAVPPAFTGDTPLRILTTSTGNAFILMGSVTSTGADLLEWYPSQAKFVLVRPANFASFFGEGIVRSQDHRKVLLDVGSFHVDLYDSASDQFTTTYTSQYDSPFIAANPDGTQFIIGTDVVDSNLTKIGSVQGVNPFTTGAIYSRDGSHIYVVGDVRTDTTFKIVDSGTLAVTGKAPNMGGNIQLLDIDETGILIEWLNAGWGLVDVSKAQPLGTVQPSIGGLQPPQGVLGQMNSTTINGAGFLSAPSVWFGSSLAPVVTRQSSNALQVVTPALYDAGPVNVTATLPDGSFAIAPDAFTLGPHILEMLTDGGSTAGGTPVEVLGYGFAFDASQIQVTVGGQPATVTSVSTFPGISPFSFPVHHLKFTTPAGAVGPADVTIQTPAGATTLAKGFQYVDAQSFTNGNVYSQVVYDRSRQGLYLATATGKIDVFSIAQQQFVTTVTVGGKVASMAITPDASRLVVANSGDDSIEVIDLSTDTVTAHIAATDSCFPAGSEPQQVVTTSLNTAFITINYFSCGPTTNLRQLDLNSLTLSNRSASVNYPTIVSGMAATPDGTRVVMDLNVGAGPDEIWRSESDTFFEKNAAQGFPAINADATLIAMSSVVLDMQLQEIGYAAPSGIARAFAPFLFVLNEQLDPSGGVMYSNDGNQIDLYDTGHGSRRRKIAAGPPINSVITPAVNAFAVDETGLRIFTAISGNQSSGFVTLTLDSLPLAIGTLNPAHAAASGGTLVTIRGSGFRPGSTVAFNNTVAAATWIDQHTLTVTMPPVAPGFVRITVTNPNREQFSMDTAFRAD